MPKNNYSQKKCIKHWYDYIFFIKYILYKNAHDITIFIFLNVIIFLKIGCANLDAAPILPPLLYSSKKSLFSPLVHNILFHSDQFIDNYYWLSIPVQQSSPKDLKG